MKKCITALLTVLFATQLSAQLIDTSFSKEEYLAKRKKQNTIGYVLVGGGFALTVTGFVVGVSGAYGWLEGDFTEGEEKMNVGGVLIIVGTAAMISSIPFFIAAGQNRKKAMNLSAGMQEVSLIQNNSYSSRSVPSLTVKIPL